MSTRTRLAYWLRCYADRIDRAGAPKLTHWTFTFEDRIGVRFREDGRGCRLAYLGDIEYEKAHTEAGPVLPGRLSYVAADKIPTPGWAWIGEQRPH